MPNYNPYQYYPTQSNAFPTQMNVGPTQPTQNIPQIQDGGFVTIPSEEMVYNYPVAMGKCVTFKVEGKPIIIEKSMGFSQLDAPKIERYRLVKEEAEEKVEKSDDSVIDSLKSDIEKIWGKIDEMEQNSRKNTPRRENKNGES